MSQQIQITGGAKVRNLEGVLTGTSGVVNALGINVPSGIPQLDGSGKILVSQLPNSVMEYKGTWNAATNTPTLADGTGNQGDVYLCNVAGTVNFGSGPIAFFVGDQVIYSGTIWQRASGASGTVTSVAVTESGDALSITGSPITTSGTINIGFAGTSGQYINGAGGLTTFPSLTGFVPYTGATTNVNLGTHTLSAYNLIVNHTSGSGVAASITKGGSGEALTVIKTSGSGNAASITGGVTLLDELHLTTDLADAYIASAATWNAKQNAITLTTTGTSGAATLVGATLNIPQYQGVLTNPVTGTGTTNTLPKFTGTSAIGNSNITDDGTRITLGSITRLTGAGTFSTDTTVDTGDALMISSAGATAASGAFGSGLVFGGVGISANPRRAAIVPVMSTTSADTDRLGLAFFTHPSATGTDPMVEMMRLDSNGGLSLGSTGFAGYNLYLGKDLSGAVTSVGVAQQGIVASTTINEARSFDSLARTAAASFTLGIYTHYRTQQATLGAGSAITNQYGFWADASLIGATNNFGYYGNIPSGTNRWNLYMNGTAANYMAGSLGIGSTSLTGRNLVIDKTLTGSTVGVSLINTSVIASDVTNTAAYFRSDSATQAASFTINTLRHFFAVQGTFGAGSVVSAQTAFEAAASLVGGTNNYGFRGSIPVGTGRWNLYMDGTADNFLAGNVGIGSADVYVSSGPILTTTLTNGGSGYVDGTYTDVAASAIAANGFNALFTIVVSGGIVTTATLTWGGSSYKVGQTLTVSNTLLGGTGSGLIITVATVDSSQLKITNANGGDITLFRLDNSVNTGDNIGTIKWEGLDSNAKGSGLYAEIGAFGAGTAGGAYLSFFTRSATAGTSLVEAMRIGDNGSVGIGATSLTGRSLSVAKNITGATISYGIFNGGVTQSDVTNFSIMYISNAQTAAAAFTLNNMVHYYAQQATLGAGSTITNQYGFFAELNLVGATNNYGFFGVIPAGTNRWNLFMSGTANNYLAGSLGIGSTGLTGYNLRIAKSITGGTSVFSVRQEGTVQADVTSDAIGFRNDLNTTGSAFTLTNYFHYYAIQNTIGAGSAVTNQYGYAVTGNMTGATNNYGFHGGIPAGTNRWNLYMAGTAANYMAGKLLVGSTTDSGQQFQVNGTSLFQNAAVGLIGSFRSATANGQRLDVNSTSTGIRLISGFDTGVTGTFEILAAGGSSVLTLGTQSTERMRISGSGVGVNTGASNNASAILQADSTTQGFLPPRMTATQRAAIASPATGLIVYQTDGTEGVYVFSGGSWKSLTMV